MNYVIVDLEATCWEDSSERAFSTRPTIGLRKALQKQSMTFQGNPHSGIDDAKNAARLAQLILVLDY
jgi:inhibitor of KinA sporulation pathway (predicted exonuclease)